MRLGTAFVEVRPDTKNFRADLQRDTERDAKDIGRTLGAALAGGAFLAGAKKATDAASQLEQAVGGTAAVFGEASGQVEDFAKSAAEGAGLSERAARELTSTLGGLLKGFGFTANEAAGLSVQLATLGADLAATFGGNPEEAVQALGAALRGETDPLERFGIALNQTLVNQRAVELGLAATTSKVDQHAKAQATLSLITERSADAQGQFAREADTAAGQAAISAAKMENSAADLGQNLLPIYTKISEVVGVLADGFGALPEPVQTAVIALAGIAALSGPVKLGAEAIGSLATIVRTRLAQGLDAAAKGAYSLSGNLGKAALAGGTLAVAAYAVTRALSEEAAEAAAAEARVDGFKDAIIEAGDAAEGAALRVAFLADEAPELASVLDAAGVSATALGAALVGPKDEFEVLKARLLESADAAGLTDEQIALLGPSLDAMRGTAQTAATQAEVLAGATGDVGDAASGAAPKVQELTDKLTPAEQAAKDAAESVDLFREAVEKALQPLDFQAAVDARAQALDDLAAGIDARAQAVIDARQRIDDLQAQGAESAVSDTRAIADAERNLAEARAQVADTDSERESRTRAIADAERALARAREDAGGGDNAKELADAQRDLDEAIAGTSLTLVGNSDAARRNREELRDLVDDSVGVIEAAREQGRSLDDLRLIRAGEVESLKDQLRQMGYNEAEIADYVKVIEDIPITKATTLTVETAKAENKLKAALERWQNYIDVNPLSADVLFSEKSVARTGGRPKTAAGGLVMDGEFSVGEAGVEILRKRGSEVEVIAGAPSALGGGQVNNIAVYVTGTTGESPAEALHRAARRIAEEVGAR